MKSIKKLINAYFLKSFFCLSAVSLVTGGCASFKAERLSDKKADEKAMEITDKWVDGDTNLVITDTLTQISTHPRFKRFLKRSGKDEIKVFVANVNNNTSEAYFPTADLEDALLDQLSRSDIFVLIDAKARENLLKEINYQNDGMVDPAQAKMIGKQSGADAMIFGSVNMKPEQRGGRTIKTYTVNFHFTDIQSGEEVCRTRSKINKFSEHASAGW